MRLGFNVSNPDQLDLSLLDFADSNKANLFDNFVQSIILGYSSYYRFFGVYAHYGGVSNTVYNSRIHIVPFDKLDLGQFCKYVKG